MDNLIYIDNGILDQIKNFGYICQYTIIKKDVFDYWIQEFKDFYKRYPYAIKWNYEKFIREILNYEN